MLKKTIKQISSKKLLSVAKNILPFGIIKYIYKLRKKNLSMDILSYNRFENMSRYIRRSIPKLPDDIDLIVGIPRSGMIPAYMISLFMNKPCCSITEFKNGIFPEHGKREIDISNTVPKKILIVDDSIFSGSAMDEIKKELKNINSKTTFLYYAVFATELSKSLIDYYGTITDSHRIFQWNYMHHSILSQSCVDIDGVLCVDPTEEENDDGMAYRKFILTAKPLYIPKVKIYALVTSRLEKYRYETEIWLKNNNVYYEKLIMLDLNTAKERQQKKSYALFKASIYKKHRKAILFIESNDTQAKEIAKLSKKPCICIETDSLY